MDGMIDGLWSIAGLIDEDTKVIPGHGQLATRNDLLEFRTMLVTIRARLKASISEGLSIEQILNTYPARGYAEDTAETRDWLRETYDEYL